MAAIIKRELGIDAALVSGGRGEFTIWLDGRKILDIAEDPDLEFPDEAKVLAALARR